MDTRHTIDELITILSDTVTEAWSMPLSGGKILLDRSRVLDLINEIKAVMPGDIQQARAIVESRNELTAAARRDADSIIKAAEDKAHALVSESAVYSEANRAAEELKIAAIAKAKDIIASAENQARQTVGGAEQKAAELVRSAESRSNDLRNATTQFVTNALTQSEEAVANALNELHRVKQQLKK